MPKIKAVRGTKDILNETSKIWQWLELNAIQTLMEAGFDEIRTPIFESTSLFARAVGEDTDIVNKEMYTFNDRSDRSLTLRPEGTAAIVRAYLEHALDRSTKPCKLWYRGPMFRYERPQTGRYRQFQQIGVEVFGLPAPYIDLEVVALAIRFMKRIGLHDLTLHINSIANTNSRLKYRDALKEFLLQHKDEVCEDCVRRIETNPLRALDCKVPADQAIYKNAPQIEDYYDDESKTIWHDIKAGFDELGIKYIVDPRLVRGLDYYNHLVFEIKTTDPGLGQQSTVLAGGRYDGLVEKLGGSKTPAVGWALGLERLAYLIAAKELEPKSNAASLFIVSDDAIKAQQLAIVLREECKIKVEYEYEASTKIAKQITKADKRGANLVLFYLEDERAAKTFKIKNLKTGEEIKDLSIEAIIKLLKNVQQ
jgi:histidyl-tRNA synthetase